ncbi:MAG: Na/Pi cotransporter family protein [Rhodovulum sp.]|nr:Na/Pi cotransporter family protein [Rhodovulum sp.]
MTAELNQFDLWTGLAGGLALFLFGMDLMTAAVKRAAGEHLKTLLGRVTRNRFLGALAGAAVTGLVNSSTVTTVILVGFISAGLMSMAQSVSVIMGANIGSTVTAQILAFNVTRLALPMIALGFLVAFQARWEAWKDYGRMLLGLGFVFYGMGLMSAAMVPLRTNETFIDFVAALANPVAAILTGMIFTALVHSSATTTGIVIVLAGQGMLTLETAIAVALGANVGTCATAGLAAIGKPREAVRAALVHVLFNVAGVLIWVAFIPQLAALVRYVSPAGDVPRQVANAHTIFNVANTLVFIGFTTQIARLVEWIVPDSPITADEPLKPLYLDTALLSTPAVAMENARRELGRMGSYVADMLDRALPAVLGNSRGALHALEAMDKPVDRLHQAIIAYLGRVSLNRLSEDQAQTLMQLVAMSNDLEHVGDRIATDLTTSTRKRLDEHAPIRPEAARRITAYHADVAKALRQAVQAVMEEDAALAAEVRGMKREVTVLSRDIARERFRHVPDRVDGALMAYVREVEIVEILDGIFKIARRIARGEIETEAEPEPDATPVVAAAR